MRVTIAVVDTAVDTRHPEFEGRVVTGRDTALGGSSPVPVGWQPHGTEVAGLALARGLKVRGMAPNANLMGIRVPALGTAVGDPTEALAIRWAAEHGADVICCAWGPPCAKSRSTPLPPLTAAAIDWALAHGREGKGCVIVFSSGNDGSDIALNGYASHPDVIAVGACNRHGRRPSYSGWGDALWCVAPSNDPRDAIGASETYTTTTPVGSFLLGETYYTSSFGFTSAACAIVAGICAQVLTFNPRLTWRQVKQVLAESCGKIDAEGGSYDSSGRSPYYGFGRVDPDRAYEIAHRKSGALSV